MIFINIFECWIFDLWQFYGCAHHGIQVDIIIRQEKIFREKKNGWNPISIQPNSEFGEYLKGVESKLLSKCVDRDQTVAVLKSVFDKPFIKIIRYLYKIIY